MALTQQHDMLGQDAAQLIADPRLRIGGAWVEGQGGAPEPSIDPFTETVVGEFRPASLGQTQAAVAAARIAFDDGPWTRLSPRDRSRALQRAVDALARRRDALVEIVVAEIGSPVTLARVLQVDAMLEHLAWHAEAARRGPAGGYEVGLPVHAGPPASTGVLVREPIGVVAALTPYNIPLVGAAWKVGAALAAGCTTVLMPSSRAQLTALAFARALEDADLPPGVFNLVTGGRRVGQELTTSPAVDMITFTGSTSVGASIMAQAAPTLKKVTLELGGKSPNILLPGADVETAALPSVLRFTRNAGQACGATTRTFVPRRDYDRYTAAVRGVFADLAVGDPWDERTVVGPLIRPEHRESVEGYVERALTGGGRLEAGGGRPATPTRGWFMNPALVGGVGNRAEISQEELFGPVGVVIPYDDVDDAVAMANDCRYGLNANVWGPAADAVRVARMIRSGTVTINGGGGLRPDAPFGGYRHSGIGREAGEEGFLEFFEVKHLQWPLGS